MDSSEAIAIGSLATAACTFLTVVANLVYQGLTRHWDARDRERIAADASAHALEIKDLTRIAGAKADVAAMKAGEAYAEANNVNLKLHALGVSIQAGAVVPAHVPEAVAPLVTG